MNIEQVEILMKGRQERFFKLVKELTPLEADRKASLIELCIEQAFYFASEDKRKSMIPEEWHPHIEDNSPLSYACHATNEALFSLLGNYCKGLPRHLIPMKFSYSQAEAKQLGFSVDHELLHRFNVSAYSGKVFDASLDQIRRCKDDDIRDYIGNAKIKPYGKNGYPRDLARSVIHYLKELLEDEDKGTMCFGEHLYQAYYNELYNLVKAAADYWPLKHERDSLEINFFNRTERQATEYSNRAESKLKAAKARTRRLG